MSEQQDYDYVIVGGGVAAAKAVKGIRSQDESGSILVLGAEPDPPIYRPDLSKALWLSSKASLEKSTLTPDGAEVRTSATVTAIDPDAHTVTVEGGSTVGYRRLLLATGAAPRTLGLEPGPRVLYYRTVADYRHLRAIATAGSHVLVVGGGYIGSEITSALVQNDVRVTLVLDEDDVMQRLFPAGLARHVTQTLADRGVKVVHGTVSGGESSAEGVSVRLEDCTEITADAVVIGIGVQPRTELAEQAGLEVSDGVAVDDHLRSSAPDVYAAGDVASYPDLLLGRRRVEHVDHAEGSGKAAGANMAGADAAYEATPFFWSDILDAGYEAIGEVDSRHTMVEDWADEDYGAGVVYYLDGGQVRGVLLWNVWDQVPTARDLIAATATTPVADPESLRGRIAPG